jgi:hypothetical protein
MAVAAAGRRALQFVAAPLVGRREHGFPLVGQDRRVDDDPVRRRGAQVVVDFREHVERVAALELARGARRRRQDVGQRSARTRRRDAARRGGRQRDAAHRDRSFAEVGCLEIVDDRADLAAGLLCADPELVLARGHLELAHDTEERSHLGHRRTQDDPDDIPRTVLHFALP